MSNKAEKLVRGLQIAGETASALTGNLPAVIRLYELIAKAYEDIKRNPGDFDLGKFQERLDALPDYPLEEDDA